MHHCEQFIRTGYEHPGAVGVQVLEMGDRTYAVVGAHYDNGMQVMDITDPASPTPVSAVFDDEGGFEALGGASHLKIFERGDSLYVIVPSGEDNGVQIARISESG